MKRRNEFVQGLAREGRSVSYTDIIDVGRFARCNKSYV
eukprot:COSAG05_NODE_219_length_13727_cov_118.855958_3_plen_38_part_00